MSRRIEGRKPGPSILLVLVVALFWIVSHTLAISAEETSARAGTIKLGWIGALTGSQAKYAFGQAALLAQEDINAEGGIRGRKLQLIMEDSQAQGNLALSAFEKLVASDRVAYVITHLTPVSAPIAPLAEKKGVIVVAAVTSSPNLTGINPNFFRISQVNTAVADLVADYAWRSAGSRTAAMILEETDYVLPIGARFKSAFSQLGGRVVYEGNFAPKESDFRAIITRVRAAKPDTVYVGVQGPEVAQLLVTQARQVGLGVPLIGNEAFGTAAPAGTELSGLFKGVVFAEPEFDEADPATGVFIREFKRRYHVDAQPISIWTAEAYDAVRLLAKAIGECGEEIEAVKQCLLRAKDYPGASGLITINSKHDGVRHTVLKRVEADGTARVLK